MEIGEAGMARTLLRQDPLLLGQILLARAKVILLPVPQRPVQAMIGGVKFEFDFADAALLDSFQHSRPAMHAMRHGSYEPTLRRAMRRYLKPGDTFIDVGANIGYVSAVGASLVGAAGQVHSFEPVPACFRRLQRLAQLNPAYKFTLNNYALGAEDGEATLTLRRGNIGGNTLVPDQIAPEHVASTCTVPVRRLGAYLSRHAIERPALIKIDVEGFEYEVIQGLASYFAATAHRPPIICEISPEALKGLGYSVHDVADHMTRLGYTAYRLTDTRQAVDMMQIEGFPNILFLAA